MRRTRRASLIESWIVDITLGVFSIGSPRRRMAAVRVAATSRAPLRRSSVVGGSGMRPQLYAVRLLFVYTSEGVTQKGLPLPTLTGSLPPFSKVIQIAPDRRP